MVIGDLFKIQFKQLATAIPPIPHTYTHRWRKNVDKFWSILRHFGSIIILKNANNKGTNAIKLQINIFERNSVEVFHNFAINGITRHSLICDIHSWLEDSIFFCLTVKAFLFANWCFIDSEL